jgi:hypothetical protein
MLLSRLLMVIIVSTTIVVTCFKEVNTAIFIVTWVSMPFSALVQVFTIPFTLVFLLKAGFFLNWSAVCGTAPSSRPSRLLFL